MRPRRSPPALILSFLLVFGFAAGPARAQTDDAQRLIALAREDSRVMEHLDHLSNRIGPRLTGSDAYETACAWALAQFEAFGLENCRLERWGEIAVGFNRGPASGRMLAPELKELSFATNAWTAGTRGRVSGIAVLAPSTAAELDAVRAKLPGAWVVSRASSGRGRGAPQGSREFRDQLEAAYDEAGIAGTIRPGRGELLLTSGSPRITFDKLPTRPAIQLLAAQHGEIVKRIEAGEEVRLEFDIRNWFKQGPIAQHNVIAEIRGSEKPDEVVIVGGHLDTWDGATGTNDNGTGVATALEAARLLVKAGVKPKRTIRFMLWGGEEQGLLGSRAYVEKHRDAMASVSAVLVHDGGTNYCAGITATPAMTAQLREVFAPVASLDPELPFEVREVQGLSGGGSDHDSFLRADVPGFFWIQKGRAVYSRTHHTQFDTFEQAIPEYQRNSAIVIAVGALGIANLPALLSRENLRAPSRGQGGRRLGVMLADDMTIDEIVEDSVAARAGLLAGDKVLRIGQTPTPDSAELRAAMQAAPAKTTVTVLRAGSEVVAAIEFPPDAAGGGSAAARLGLRLGAELEVEEVSADGAAEKAGVRAGDRIVKAGGADVANARDLFRALGAADGETRIVVVRDGQEIALTLAGLERP